MHTVSLAANTHRPEQQLRQGKPVHADLDLCAVWELGGGSSSSRMSQQQQWHQQQSEPVAGNGQVDSDKQTTCC
jgi:hypothetical protein